MRTLKLSALALGCLALGSTLAQAAPRAIAAMADGATTYSFFVLDAKRLNGRTTTQMQNDLQGQLDAIGSGITACWVAGDLNVTNLSCGNGAMRFGNAELYTYNLESNIAGVPIRLDKAVREAQGANFLSPNGTFLGDTAGRVIRIHFNQRVAQFGLLADAGAATAPTVSGVQFIVNRQTTPVQPLVPGGGGTFVGVEDRQGFTDVVIVPAGPVGLSRAFIADQFAFVPLASF